MNGTEMCNVKDGKLIGHWRENKTTKAFLEALSLHTGIPISGLLESTKGGHDRGSTWLHPMVAIHLAMWISAEFAVRVMDWTFRFIIGDLTLVEDLVEHHEAVNVGAHVKATVTASSHSSFFKKKTLCLFRLLTKFTYYSTTTNKDKNINAIIYPLL